LRLSKGLRDTVFEKQARMAIGNGPAQRATWNVGMPEICDMSPKVRVERAEYLRLLGYPRGHVMSERAQCLALEAAAWYADRGKPWIYTRRCSAVRAAPDALLLDGTCFRGPGLQRVLREVSGAFVVAASAGLEVDQHARGLWDDDRPDAYFFLETYASAVVEALVGVVRERLGAWAGVHGMALGSGLSPGFPGWELGQQGRLLGVIRAGAPGGLPGNLEALSTGMLRPKKSLLAVIGFGVEAGNSAMAGGCGRKADFCQKCAMTRCAYRRVSCETERAACAACPTPSFSRSL
jgi:hypothetical protein